MTYLSKDTIIAEASLMTGAIAFPMVVPFPVVEHNHGGSRSNEPGRRFLDRSPALASD